MRFVVVCFVCVCFFCDMFCFFQNDALRAAGAFVPDDFDKLGATVEAVYQELVKRGTITVFEEPPVPKIPMDFDVSLWGLLNATCLPISYNNVFVYSGPPSLVSCASQHRSSPPFPMSVAMRLFTTMCPFQRVELLSLVADGIFLLLNVKLVQSWRTRWELVVSSRCSGSSARSLR